MTTDLCPTCATPRMGSFRYCRSCGFDYDAAVSAASAPMPGTPAPAPVTETAPPPMMHGAGTQPTTASGSVGSASPAGGAAAPPPAARDFNAQAGAVSGTAAPPPAGGAEGATPPADEVVVIKVRTLKLVAGGIVGGLIGAMITGAFILPALGTDRLAVGIVLGIVTIVALAALGARAGLAIIGH